MCGILFTLEPEKYSIFSGGQVIDASTKLLHRGPDGLQDECLTLKDGTYCSAFFCRLAIINEAVDGMQPFKLGTSRLICNGELYNYEDLMKMLHLTTVHSDVEPILHMLHLAKEPIAHVCLRLDGDYAFVYTSETDIIVARDPIGVRPLFYACYKETIVAFASEAKSLVQFGEAYKIHVFPSGCYWQYCTKQVRPYTNIYSARPVTAPVEDVRVRVREILTAAVQKRVDHTDRPLGFLCSGGLDSSLVVAIASDMYPDRQLHAFDISFEDGSSEDSYYAAELLKKLPNVTHTHVVLTKEDIKSSIKDIVKVCETHDAVTIRAAVPMHWLAKHIRDNTDIKVILSGEGADELFGGYTYFNRANEQQLEAETKRLVHQLHTFDLLRADRCFANFGLEVRVSFLDKDLVRYVLATPGALRMPGNLEKGLLRDSFAHLDVLDKTGILRRGKLPMSEGVGSSMVLHILKVLNGSDEELFNVRVISPEAKLEKERAVIKQYFCDIFGQERMSLIFERTMPFWV
jgi:asparagine synthase (glutamine-hydrolysing)